MSKIVNQEIDPEHVWINISKDKTVRAAVLTSYGNGLIRGVYKLEAETINTVKIMVDLAKKGESIRFYIIEEVKEDK